LAAGTYFYRWFANDSLGNLNYSEKKYYIINKAENHLTLLSSGGWAYSYGTESTFSCSSTFGSPNLYIDNILALNPANIVLAAGSHSIKCNISESENYTSEMSQGTLTISKALSQTSLTFDKSSPQTYGNSLIPACSVAVGSGSASLSLDGNIISSGELLNLSAGTYSFNCSQPGNQNYTSSSNYSQFIISKAQNSVILAAYPSSPAIYGNTSNFSC
jgi:hypothetical protein